MGNSFSGDDDAHAYNKNPRLREELREGAEFLQRFQKMNFQYYGDFEQVWRVKDNMTNEFFSLHERQKSMLNQTSTYASYVIKENHIIQKLESPFVIRLRYACQDQRILVMLTELIHSRLSYYIKKQMEFDEESLRYIAASVVLGLENLHSKNIIHRDLKPASIITTPKGNVKLSNFLFAREHDMTINNSIDNTGTPGYMAPEIIEKKFHSYTVDYYALGIILYEMATFKKLFEGTQEENLERMNNLEIQKKDLPEKYSEELIDLINSLLRKDPKERLGSKDIQDIKNHQWFVSFEWQSLLTGKMKSPLVSREEEKESVLNNEKLNAQNSLSKKLSNQNLYLGYQYGFVSSKKNTKKNDLNSLI